MVGFAYVATVVFSGLLAFIRMKIKSVLITRNGWVVNFESIIVVGLSK